MVKKYRKIIIIRKYRKKRFIRKKILLKNFFDYKKSIKIKHNPKQINTERLLQISPVLWNVFLKSASDNCSKYPICFEG